MVQSVVCLTVALTLASLLFASVVDGASIQNRPGLPNFNGPELAVAMGQLIPDPSSLTGNDFDDTDFLSTPCSVDIHFGSRAEYSCFCAETVQSLSSDFYCNKASVNIGELGQSGTDGVLLGNAINGAGTALGGVEVAFENDCYIKDVNVRLKITSTNASELNAGINLYTYDTISEDVTTVIFPVTGAPASILLVAGQQKTNTLPTDTCLDYRLGAYYSPDGGFSDQNKAIKNIDAAFDDKIGLFCQPLPLLGGSGKCIDDMPTYQQARDDAISAGGAWQKIDGVAVSFIPQYCPANKGQSYSITGSPTVPADPTDEQLSAWYVFTDAAKDQSDSVASGSELLATNTIVGSGVNVHQTGAPDAGTGQGLNVFDGFKFVGGASYSPCYEALEPDVNGDSLSAYAFYINMNDLRQSQWCDNAVPTPHCGVSSYINQWCIDVLCEEIPPSITPTETAIVITDPHFVGFHGEKFDVMAEPGEVFNILSDSDVQLNALFVGSHKGASQTFLGECGIKYGRHNVRLTASGHVFVDDVPLSIAGVETKYSLDRTGEAYITAKSARNGNVDAIVTLPNYSFKFGLVSSRNTQAGSVAHINLQITLRSSNVRPHGLIGQTVVPPSLRAGQRGHNSMKEGGDVIEGSFTQYKIADNNLFGDDFKFNMFGKPALAKRDDDMQINMVNKSAFLG